MSKFVVTFATKPGTDGIQALKALLKIAGRSLGLRCVAAGTVDDAKTEEETKPGRSASE